MTACARGGVRFLESRRSRASLAAGEKRERVRARSLSRSPRRHAGPARNRHLKRGRNDRGASGPGVFLTRIPHVRASHLLILLFPSLLLVLLGFFLLFSFSPLPFGFLILPFLPFLHLLFRFVILSSFFA